MISLRRLADLMMQTYILKFPVKSASCHTACIYFLSA